MNNKDNIEQTIESSKTEVNENENQSVEIQDEIDFNDIIEMNSKKGRKAKKSKKAKKDKVRFYKKPGFRYSMLATVLSIVFIVVIVVVNVFASMLDNRVNALQLDMTLTQDYTISSENVDYIKKLDKDITVTVAATEDFYTGSYGAYLEQYYYYSDSSNGKLFYQTAQLMKKYPKINSRIKLQFIDPQTPAFDEFNTKYRGEYEMGSIIVECSFTNSKGNAQSRYKILGVDDVYNIETGANQSEYVVSSSKIESALTSALYYVSSEQQDKAVILTGYGCDEATDLVNLLKQNNYDISEISSLITEDIPSDVKTLIIAAPTSDLTPNEVKKIDSFLLGYEEYGRTLIYVASNSQHKLTNLEGMIKEWGISFEEGSVYETDENSASSSDNKFMLLNDGGTDYTKNLRSVQFLCKDMRPMTVDFEQKSSYYTYNIVKSNDTTTVMPSGSKDSWKPDSTSSKKSYSSLALSIYTGGTDEEKNVLSSSVIAVSSLDFYNEQYTTDYSFSNQPVLLDIVNSSAGRIEDSYTFTEKVANSSSFAVTESQSEIIKYICCYVIPVIVIVVAVLVVIRRKRK